MRAKKIKYIAYHCSAGFGNIDSMKKYWRSLGWKTDGYHIVVDLEGKINFIVPFDKDSNGVAGYNSEIINICYIGGVEASKDKKGNTIYKGKDTRTEAQKIALDNALVMVTDWLRNNGNDCKEIIIVGHRDFSPDQNKNGIIDSYERIKECPSFEVKTDYAFLQKALNGKTFKLPKK